MILNLYKQRGETPLECLNRFKIAYPEHKNEKKTYLGRLDPMAEGVLLVATEEDTKQTRKEEFLALDKDYEFVALFGFATDTYDCLGKIIKVEKVENLNEMDLIKICNLYEGEREQKYPFYSSKQISSRKRSSSESPRVSSFHSARLSSEDFSSKKVLIYKMQFRGLEELKPKELFGRLLMDISKVKGDFRQVEILQIWKEKLVSAPSPDQGEGRVGWIAKFSAFVSSGTYIRSIVNDMGATLGCGACALSIKRTRVGDYTLTGSLQF